MAPLILLMMSRSFRAFISHQIRREGVENDYNAVVKALTFAVDTAMASATKCEARGVGR